MADPTQATYEKGKLYDLNIANVFTEIDLMPAGVRSG